MKIKDIPTKRNAPQRELT
uniref:Uncharacterized protein n=1 Tax=Arundo donax TaxID=35708 RepID=A0A0A9BNB3_ARUDO